jgi:hypothetical protein
MQDPPVRRQEAGQPQDIGQVPDEKRQQLDPAACGAFGFCILKSA